MTCLANGQATRVYMVMVGTIPLERRLIAIHEHGIYRRVATAHSDESIPVTKSYGLSPLATRLLAATMSMCVSNPPPASSVAPPFAIAAAGAPPPPANVLG